MLEIETSPTVGCHCSALHDSFTCPKHGALAAKRLWLDVQWRVATEPLLLTDRSPAPIVALDPAFPGSDMVARTYVEAFPGSGLCLPADQVNMVKPEGSDLPVISMIRPFKESAGTRAMIEAFKKANPVIEVPKPKTRMSSGNVNLKPIIDEDFQPGTRVTSAKQIWWCDVHDREATHLRRGEYQCDPKLAGITMPCRVRAVLTKTREPETVMHTCLACGTQYSERPCPNCFPREREQKIRADVYRPNETDEEYFFRRRKERLGY